MYEYKYYYYNKANQKYVLCFTCYAKNDDEFYRQVEQARKDTIATESGKVETDNSNSRYKSN